MSWQMLDSTAPMQQPTCQIATWATQPEMLWNDAHQPQLMQDWLYKSQECMLKLCHTPNELYLAAFAGLDMLSHKQEQSGYFPCPVASHL